MKRLPERLLALCGVMACAAHIQAATVAWTNNAATTAWYTANNWNPNTASGAWTTGDLAQFNNTGTATTAGINMGTASLSIGAIEMTSARTRALTIGNSSATVGTLTLNGATVNSVANVVLRNASGSALTLQDNETGTGKTMNIALGNATDNIIAVDGAGAITITSLISGTGRKLTKSGTGTLNLGATNTYSGATTVNAGRLNINGGSAAASSVTVAGGTLGGTGTINGATTVQSGGNLSPGTSIGTLTIATNLTLLAGSTNIFEVDTDTLARDLVTGVSNLTCAGTMIITHTGSGLGFIAGAEIQLFSAATYSGSFSAFNLPAPLNGLVWDTSTVASNGKIRLIPALPIVYSTILWTNVAGGNMLWTNALNWQAPTNSAYPGSPTTNVVPTHADRIFFATTNDVGATSTNVLGAVNNIVDTSLTVGPILFQVQEPGYHTLQINAGASLYVTNPFTGAGDPFDFRGSRDESSITGYVTIKGQGRLIVGDTNSPNPAAGNQIRIHAVASPLVPGGTTGANTNGPFMATIDMADLDYFATATGELKVGASATSGRGTRGTFVLAKTNLVIAGCVTNNFFGIILGGATGGDYQPGGSMGEIQLGQVNDIRANAIRVGGPRAQLGTLRFRSGLVNPTVKMRNADGTSAMGLLSAGDNFQTGTAGATTSTPETSTGNLDLTGGTVDIVVNSIRVGRNLNSNTTGNNGPGVGTMTWTAGTITCLGSADIGKQNNNNTGSATGVMNVLSNAVMLSVQFRVGSDAGGAAGTGNGTLNIAYGGQVTATNGIVEDVAGAGSSTVNITNGTLSVGGTSVFGTGCSVDTMRFNNATITALGGTTNFLDVTNALVQLGGLIINDGGFALTNSQPFRHDAALGAIADGGFIKNGAGTLTLTATNSFTGDTLINTGSLVLGATGWLSNTVTIASGAALKGNGAIGGKLVVDGTVAPGTSIGALSVAGSVTLDGGGSDITEVINANGPAGSGYDVLFIQGGIDVQATSGSKFNLKLVSFNGSGAAGNVTNFNNDASYNWTVTVPTQGVTNFDASKFNVDTSAFSNDLAGGEFLLEPTGLRFTNNHAPVANAANFSFAKGMTFKALQLPIPGFLAANTSDTDNDPRSLISVTSTNATVSTNGGVIDISSTNDVAESIQYVVRDLRNYRGGDTVRMATNYINILRTNGIGTLTLTNLGGGSMSLTFYGIPGRDYIVQRSSNMVIWDDILTNTAPANSGLIQLTETPPYNPAFYRTRLP